MEDTKRVRLVITPKLAAEHSIMSNTHCPVAQAIKRHVKPDVDVMVLGHNFMLNGGDYIDCGYGKLWEAPKLENGGRLLTKAFHIYVDIPRIYLRKP